MIRALIFLFVFPLAAFAQDVTTDAFGIVPTVHLDEREDWAGLRESPTEGPFVQQAQAVGATILFVGPKSIVAGIEPGHAVALGLDVYGNMVDGTVGEFGLGFGPRRVAQTEFGIAHVLFTPPPRAGGYLAGAEVGGVQSSRADYRVTAHLATVQPTFEQAQIDLLPETMGQIATSPLVDGYGNAVDDGVGLSFLLTDENGRATFVTSATRDGAARSMLLTRSLSGEASVDLALAGTSATGLTVSVAPMVIGASDVVRIWPEPAINAVRVRIGPLQTDEGFLVPDGTAGTVQVTAADGEHQRAEAWALDGYMDFVMVLAPDTGPFGVTLDMAGNRIEQAVSLSPIPENDIVRGAE